VLIAAGDVSIKRCPTSESSSAFTNPIQGGLAAGDLGRTNDLLGELGEGPSTRAMKSSVPSDGFRPSVWLNVSTFSSERQGEPEGRPTSSAAATSCWAAQGSCRSFRMGIDRVRLALSQWKLIRLTGRVSARCVEPLTRQRRKKLKRVEAAARASLRISSIVPFRFPRRAQRG